MFKINIIFTLIIFSNQYVVTNTSTQGTGSLKWALDMVNQEGADTIIFSIPQSDPGYNPNTGKWTILDSINSYIIYDSFTVIDALTQPGASCNNRKIILKRGTMNTPNMGYTGFEVYSSNVLIRGFIIRDYYSTGIVIKNASDVAIECNDLYSENYWNFNINTGIEIKRSKNTELKNNIITLNGYAGIIIDSSIKISLTGNYLNLNAELGESYLSQIYMNSSDSIILKKDSIEGWSAPGILIEYTKNILIDSSYFTYLSEGIRIDNSENLRIKNSLFLYDGIPIKIFQNSKYVWIANNKFEESGGGISIGNNARYIKVSRNSFLNQYTSSYLPIDLYPAGENPNDGILDTLESNSGIDHPVITYARLNNDTLYLKGFIGIDPDNDGFPDNPDNSVFNPGTVEVFIGHITSNQIKEGEKYIGSLNVINSLFSGKIFPVNLLPDTDLIATYTLNNETSEFGPLYTDYLHIKEKNKKKKSSWFYEKPLLFSVDGRRVNRKNIKKGIYFIKNKDKIKKMLFIKGILEGGD